MRHEQVAAHAADGYARQTGKLGCVVTTAGPGCTNAVTGIATAFRSESPVLHIGGQGALTQHKMGSLQDLPHVDMMSPDHQVRGHRAEHRARRRHDLDGGARGVQRRPGTGHTSRFRATCSIARWTSPRRSCPSPATTAPRRTRWATRRDIEKLADILVDSERPAILYGQQVWTARGHEEAIALLRGLDIPGYFNGGSRGLLPPGDPHHFDRTRSNAFAEADVIVIVGTPFDFRMGYGKRISNKLKLVQIDRTTAPSARTATST